MDLLAEKLSRLRAILEEMGGMVLGYSGGCDSTFLAYVGREVLGEMMVPVLASSPTYPKREVAEALATAETLGLAVVRIETEELSDEAFAANTPEHCYFCKRELFGRLSTIARERHLPWIADGSNVDDLADWRPGSRAAAERGVRSPLRDAGLTKGEIRQLSRQLGLPTWDKPAFACLASRIPYGTRIEAPLLARIEEAEDFLRGLGFRQVRVRHHGEVARLEVEPAEIGRLAAPEVRHAVAKKMKELGYLYAALDLEGYRTGSMNAPLTVTVKTAPAT